MVVLDQKDGAARHADRDRELLGHRPEQVMKIERSREVGGHASEHAGRRREARQAVPDAGGRTVAHREQQGERADRRQREHGRIQVDADCPG